jgi:hypothetical protein
MSEAISGAVLEQYRCLHRARGHLFVLGDNRDNSTENFIGRVGMIFLSSDAGGDGKEPAIRYGRTGMVVQ